MASTSRDPLSTTHSASTARYGSATHVLPGHYQGRRRIYTGQKVGLPPTNNNPNTTILRPNSSSSASYIPMNTTASLNPAYSGLINASLPSPFPGYTMNSGIPNNTIYSSYTNTKPPLPSNTTGGAASTNSLLSSSQLMNNSVGSLPYQSSQRSIMNVSQTLSHTHSSPSLLLSSTSSSSTTANSMTIIPKMLNPQAEYAAYIRLQQYQQQQQQQLQIQQYKKNKQIHKRHRPAGMPPPSALLNNNNKANTIIPASPNTFRSPKRPLPRTQAPSNIPSATPTTAVSTALTLRTNPNTTFVYHDVVLILMLIVVMLQLPGYVIVVYHLIH